MLHFREFFPKKIDLATIAEKALSETLLAMNHCPRKCLSYKTAFETLRDEL